MSHETDIILEKKNGERLLTAVEVLVDRAVECQRIEDIQRKAYLSIEEAAAYCGVSPKYIRTKISKGQLTLVGECRAYRIARLEIDRQMIRGWPRLDIETPEEAVDRILALRPLDELLPQPKRPRKPAKPLVFK